VEGNALGGANIADIGTATASDIVSGTLTPTNNHPSTFYPLGTTTVTWSATDGVGLTSTAAQTITVVDTTPPYDITIRYGTDILTDWAVVPIGKSLSYSANDIVWGTTLQFSATMDGAIVPYPYGAGVWTLAVTATDGSGNSATRSIVFVIYDPSAGFVTGGGWINSPEGAYTADPALTGKATFGFVSKYQKGATVPTGNTEFQFHAAGMNFQSTKYKWLVVSGARAQFKGEGTINGISGYSFLLTVTDGQVRGGGGIDAFRIKIWNTDTNAIIYDNQLGVNDDTATGIPIGGGSIQIQTPPGKQ
jgi:hypothetical protein